jgi:hypothetical protein
MVDGQLDITNLYKKEIQQELFYDNFLIPNDDCIDTTDGQTYQNILDSFIDKTTNVQSEYVDNNAKEKSVRENDMKENDMKENDVRENDMEENDMKENDIDKIEQKVDVFNKNVFKTCLHSGEIQVCFNKNIIIDNVKEFNKIVLENDINMTIKNIYQLHYHTYPSFITTSNGSFYMDTNECKKKIIFIEKDSEWKIIGNKKNNFYPSQIIDRLNNNSQNSCFGSSVAISGNGSFYIIGGYTHLNGIGGTWIYKKLNEKFVLDCELIGLNNIGTSFQGITVAVNYNGSIVCVGGSGDNFGVGAVWIFEKQEKYWKQRKMIGSQNIGQSHQGSSICLSQNGKCMIIGGCDDDEYNGAIWIFINNENEWKEICKTCGNKKALFGKYVSTNFDGSKIFVGSKNEIYVYSLIDRDIHHDYSITQHSIISGMCIDTSHNIFFASDNIITIYYENSKNRIIRNETIKKIFSLCTCENGKTIFASGIDKNNTMCLWCFIYINKKYQLINSINLPEIKNCDDHVSLAMSTFGHNVIMGYQSLCEFDGQCYIFA